MPISKRVARHFVRTALLCLCFSACADQALESPESYQDAAGLEDKGLSTTTYQAEAANKMSGCQVVTARSGSPGYADFGGYGSWIEWNNIRANTANRYKLTFRYANGGANARRSDLVVNGKKVADIAFAKTGAWTSWTKVSVEGDLIAGDNTVRVMANTSTGGPNLDWVSVSSPTRELYTWTFGGLESMTAADAVSLLRKTGYAGIVVDTSNSGLLSSYLQATASTPDFRVMAAYVAVQLNRGERFSDARHRAAIDALSAAGRSGDLWMTFRDDHGTQTTQSITDLTRSIVAYAKLKGVRVVWYPHNANVYPTTEAAMAIVNEINAPNFGVALNLIHELRAGIRDTNSLRETFTRAGSKLFAVTLSGAASDLTTIKALHESSYNLAPFIQLIQDSGFAAPVGFLNHTLTSPQTYLPLSLEYWRGQW